MNTEIKKLSEFDLDILKNKFPDNIYITSPLFRKSAINKGGINKPKKDEDEEDEIVNIIARNVTFYKVQIDLKGFKNILYYYIFGDNIFGIDLVTFRLAENISEECHVEVGRIPVVGNDNFFDDSLIFFVKTLFKIHSKSLNKIKPNLTEDNLIYSIISKKNSGERKSFTHIPNEILIQQQESYGNTDPFSIINKDRAYSKNLIVVDTELCKSYKETLDKREKGISTEPITIDESFEEVPVKTITIN
jgi:hypothetical protein